MNTMPILRNIFKKAETKKLVLFDAKQYLVNKIGSEQIKKLADKGLYVGVATL